MENKQERIYKEVLSKVEKGKRVPLLKIIRMKCMDCTCFQDQEVKLCPATDCILWKFRLGKHPIKREMTEEQKKIASERMKNLQSKLRKK